jgi:hypothetical protein
MLLLLLLLPPVGSCALLLLLLLLPLLLLRVPPLHLTPVRVQVQQQQTPPVAWSLASPPSAAAARAVRMLDLQPITTSLRCSTAAMQPELCSTPHLVEIAQVLSSRHVDLRGTTRCRKMLGLSSCMQVKDTPADWLAAAPVCDAVCTSGFLAAAQPAPAPRHPAAGSALPPRSWPRPLLRSSSSPRPLSSPLSTLPPLHSLPLPLLLQLQPPPLQLQPRPGLPPNPPQTLLLTLLQQQPHPWLLVCQPLPLQPLPLQLPLSPWQLLFLP